MLRHRKPKQQQQQNKKLQSTHCVKRRFRTSKTKELIQKQLSTRQRYEIKPTLESHKFLVGAAGAGIKPKPIGTSCLGTCAANNNNSTTPTAEEKQMLGHLAEPDMAPVIPRQSAVLINLCTYNGIPSILFVKRSSKFGSHRGQVGFPGGMFEEQDMNDPIKCAIRETYEEIGISEHDIDYIGLHHDAGTSDKSRNAATGVVKSTIITPVLALLKEDMADFDAKLKLSQDEIQYVFTIPLAELLDDTRWSPYKGRPSFTHQHIFNNVFPLDYNHIKTPSTNILSDRYFEYQFGNDDSLLQPEQLHIRQSNAHNNINQSAIPQQPQQPSILKDRPNLDNLSIAQLQYLALTQQDSSDDDMYGLPDYLDTTEIQQKPDLRTILLAKDELLWGASGHIVNLFLKQVIKPISNELFKQ